MNESPDMQAPVPHELRDPSPDELLSALVDGELSSADLNRLMAAGQPLAASWSCYHVVGDVLRGSAGGAVPARGSSVAAVMARLRDEVPPPLPVAVPEPARVRGLAANDAVFRWKLVAGLASLAAVGVLTWQAVSQPAPSAGPQLAQMPAPAPAVAVVAPVAEPASTEVVVSGGLGPVIRDARLDELLAAHRQLGGSALQMPAGFLRNATFETPQR